MGEVEDTASAGAAPVSLGTDLAGDADFPVVDTMVVDTMSPVTIGVDTMAGAFASFMGAVLALDILTITRFIIPTITCILSTDLIWDIKCVRRSRLHAESVG